MMLKIAIIAAAAAVGLTATYILKKPHDNPIEEEAEQVIKDQTGVDVDLSPSSPEKKD